MQATFTLTKFVVIPVFLNMRKLIPNDGVLGLSKTKFYFEEGKVEQKLANGHAEQLFGKSAA